MKRTVAELHALIDARFYANSPDGEILAQWSTDTLIDICDSFAAKKNVLQYQTFKLTRFDLDLNKSIEIAHTLGLNIKLVLYDHNNKRVYVPFYDFKPLTTTSAKLTITGSIPVSKIWKGYIYNID